MTYKEQSPDNTPFSWLANFLNFKGLLRDVEKQGTDNQAYQEKLVCIAAKVFDEGVVASDFFSELKLQDAYNGLSAEFKSFKDKVISEALTKLKQTTEKLQEVAAGKPGQGKWHSDVTGKAWSSCVEAARKTVLVKTFASKLKAQQQEMAQVRESKEVLSFMTPT